ncbi:hypothetical protein GCM10010349_73160 [Streptomyces flavofungini]|nr:hypothetical protein GCM10010349_73160 [Streptomyces flavofungini]
MAVTGQPGTTACTRQLPPPHAKFQRSALSTAARFTEAASAANLTACMGTHTDSLKSEQIEDAARPNFLSRW